MFLLFRKVLRMKMKWQWMMNMMNSDQQQQQFQHSDNNETFFSDIHYENIYKCSNVSFICNFYKRDLIY